jgi:tRNA A37 threonylcarbamoyltransferase TsaD
VLPSLDLCTDNAAMVGAAAAAQLETLGPTPMDDGAYPNLPLRGT